MGAAVVEDPEDATRRAVRLGSHDLAHQPVEGLDASVRLAAPEEPGPVHVPGGEVLQRPTAPVLELDAHGPAGRWQQRGATRMRAWMLVFSSAESTNSSSFSGSPCQLPA